MSRAVWLPLGLGTKTLLRGPAWFIVLASGAVLLAASAGISFRPRTGTGNFAELCAATATIATCFLALLDRRYLSSPALHFGVAARRGLHRGWTLDLLAAGSIGVGAGIAVTLAVVLGAVVRDGPTLELISVGLPAAGLGLLAGFAVVLWSSILSRWLPLLLVQTATIAILFFTLAPSLVPTGLRFLLFPVSPRHLSTEEWSGVLSAPTWYLAAALYDAGLVLCWWALTRWPREVRSD